MSPTASTFSDTKTLLSTCGAFDLIDSAVAIVDNQKDIIYQNNAFIDFATPRTKQLQLTLKNRHIVLDQDEVSLAIAKTISHKQETRATYSYPYNAKLHYSITLKIQPLKIQQEQLILAMITIFDESMVNSMEHLIRQREKFQTLTNNVRKLSESQIKQKNLVNSLLIKNPFGVIIMDENQRVIQSNNAAQNILGIHSGQLVGTHCSQIFSCYQLYDGCPVLQKNQDLEQLETPSCDLAGDDKIFLKSSTKIHLGKHTAVLESFINISEKIKYQHELLDAVIQSETTRRIQSEFLTNMSHELRTPLHAILGFSRLGKSKSDPEQEKIIAYFEKISRSGETLLNLLNNLLDLTRLEAGKLRMKIIYTNFQIYIAQILDELQPSIDEKELTINYSPIEQYLHCDPDKIKQVLRNLLTNAIKFSPQNGKIGISAYTESEKFVCRIEDDGPGIPKNELQEVFHRFVQSSNTKTGAGGTGLGLSICREIIHLHHGEIMALETERGTKIQFCLPINIDKSFKATSN